MARKITRARGRQFAPSIAEGPVSTAGAAGVFSSEIGIKQQLAWTLPIALYYAVVGTWGHFDFGPLMGYYKETAINAEPEQQNGPTD